MPILTDNKAMTRNPGSSISQLVQLFQGSFNDLGHRVASRRVETLSFLVHRAMSGRSRDFHNLPHVFVVASGLQPLGRLAAIYHDTIYFQVDQGVLPEIHEKIGGLFEVRQGRVFLVDRIAPVFEDVAFLFGMRPGQELSIYNGLNEFLSAAFAVSELSGILTVKDMLGVVCGIEQTIPFRGKNAAGLSAPAALAERLGSLNQRRGLGLTHETIAELVQLAVTVGNSDLQNFAYHETSSFLENTWKLLPETNPEFHSVGVYSITKFRVALLKLDSFLSSFDHLVVFQRYRDVPTELAHHQLTQRAQANLSYAVSYVRAKFLAMAVLEALAELTGGDAPIAYFTGAADSNERQLQDYLPALSSISFIQVANEDHTVLNLLKFGRGGEVKFDTTASPIAAYLYEALGADGIEQFVKEAKKVYAGMRTGQEFLDRLPPSLVAALARAASEIATGRRERLLEIAEKHTAADVHPNIIKRVA